MMTDFRFPKYLSNVSLLCGSTSDMFLQLDTNVEYTDGLLFRCLGDDTSRMRTIPTVSLVHPHRFSETFSILVWEVVASVPRCRYVVVTLRESSIRTRMQTRIHTRDAHTYARAHAGGGITILLPELLPRIAKLLETVYIHKRHTLKGMALNCKWNQ